jgi:hypothetical protein
MGQIGILGQEVNSDCPTVPKRGGFVPFPFGRMGQLEAPVYLCFCLFVPLSHY